MAVIDKSEDGQSHPGLETAFGFTARTTTLISATAAISSTNDTHHRATEILPFGVSNGNVEFHPSCFLRGTHIAGVNGEVVVEALQIGDAIKTLVKGQTVIKPITWIGHRHIKVAPGAREFAFPVRIRAHAFADNIPHRDLTVTGDHCMFITDRLIPVRMLVNGGSILFDRTITSFEYFHIELASHTILLAEGMTTESYLECGDRGQFTNAQIVNLTSDINSTPRPRANTAAPVCTDCDVVEPIWKDLKRRAVARHQLRERKPAVLIGDPDLQVETQTGSRIRPYHVKNGCYRFAIPAGTLAIHLVSRACSPAEIIGPYVDDWRQLGVLVSAISLDTVDTSALFEPHKQSSSVPGWHATEAHTALRWTNGHAALPLDLTSVAHAPGLLQIDIAHAGPYLKAAHTGITSNMASQIQYG